MTTLSGWQEEAAGPLRTEEASLLGDWRVLARALRGVRDRSGSSRHLHELVVPTFVVPDDRAALEAAGLERSARVRLVCRPVRAPDDAGSFAIASPEEAPRHPGWMVQAEPSVPERRIVTRLVAIRSLEPLRVDTAPFPGDEAAPDAVGGETLAALMDAALALVAVAARETLLAHRLTGPEPAGAGPEPQLLAARFLLHRSGFANGGRRALLLDLAPADAPDGVVAWHPINLPGTDGEPEPAWELLRPADVRAVDTSEPAPVVTLPRPGAVIHPLDSEAALWLPTGELLVLNSTGTYVWAALADGLADDEIAHELATAVGAPADRTGRAIRILLAELAQVGAIVSRRVPPGGLGAILSRRVPPGGPGGIVSRRVPPVPRAIPPEPSEPADGYRLAVAIAGTPLAVHGDDERSRPWVEALLAPAREHRATAGVRADDAGASVTVRARAGGWLVTGGHFAERCLVEEQVGPTVLDALRWRALAASPGTAVRGTVLTRDGTTVAVLAAPATRRRLAQAWESAGDEVVVDDLLFLGTTGGQTSVVPGRAGLQEPAAWWQWSDEPHGPTDPEPLWCTLDGRFVRYWWPAPWDGPADPVPVDLVVVDREPLATEAVDHRTPGRSAAGTGPSTEPGDAGGATQGEDAGSGIAPDPNERWEVLRPAELLAHLLDERADAGGPLSQAQADVLVTVARTTPAVATRLPGPDPGAHLATLWRTHLQPGGPEQRTPTRPSS